MKRRLRRILLWTLGGLVLTLAVLVATFPYTAPVIPWPEVTVDLSADMPTNLVQVVSNRTISARYSFRRDDQYDFIVSVDGDFFDWPYTAKIWLDYSVFGLSAGGRYVVALDGTPWKLEGDFDATPLTWRFTTRLGETAFDETDAVLAQLVDNWPGLTLSELIFGGSVSLEASACRTRERAYPVWSARGRLKDASASFFTDENLVAVNRLQVGFGADGADDRVTVQPIRPRIESVTASEFTFSNVFASVYKTDQAYLVTEATAGFCGGKVGLYSLFLNPETLTTGCTLYLDEIDAQSFFRYVKGFDGEATGHLHGKMPVFFSRGRLHFRDGYLYSTPGETGKIRFGNAKPLCDTLSLGGIDADTCENLEKVLADIDYSALKFNLRRQPDGDISLRMCLEGTATRGSLTVPASFDLTFHGAIEQLLNTGINVISENQSKSPEGGK